MSLIDWVTVAVDLPDNLKCAELAAALDEPLVEAYLVRIWCLAGRVARDGTFRGRSADTARTVLDRIIEDGARWHGKPGQLVEALVKCRWIDELPDGSLHIHDWEKHAGRAIAKAVKEQQRKRAERGRGADAARTVRGHGADAARTVRGHGADTARTVQGQRERERERENIQPPPPSPSDSTGFPQAGTPDTPAPDAPDWASRGEVSGVRVVETEPEAQLRLAVADKAWETLQQERVRTRGLNAELVRPAGFDEWAVGLWSQMREAPDPFAPIRLAYRAYLADVGIRDPLHSTGLFMQPRLYLARLPATGATEGG